MPWWASSTGRPLRRGGHRCPPQPPSFSLRQVVPVHPTAVSPLGLEIINAIGLRHVVDGRTVEIVSRRLEFREPRFEQTDKDGSAHDRTLSVAGLPPSPSVTEG